MQSFYEHTVKPVSSLIFYASNSRTHSESQVNQIAASINEWGFTNPVLIDEAGSIIAGHGRIQAAKKLGLQDVPCVIVSGLTEGQKKAYVIADNKLALNAGWDDELLSAEFQSLEEMGFDLSLTGFAGAELDDLIHRQSSDESAENTPDAEEVAISEEGDVWQLGNHRLICGDSTRADVVEALLGAVQPHLMVTDPPYGVEYDPLWRTDSDIGAGTGRLGTVLNDERVDWGDAYSLFPGHVAYVWHSAKHTAEVARNIESSGFVIRSQIIWAKDNFCISRGDYHWQHEPCWYAVKKAKSAEWCGNRAQSTIWKINRIEDKGHGHSTQKPVECMLRPILNNSSCGQAIYEPFSGSGTTIIACEKAERHCYAIELSPIYVDVAVRRWQEYTGQQATDAAGLTFSAREQKWQVENQSRQS